jgi:hypothetical protein
MLSFSIFLVTLGVRALRAVFRSREELLIENLALRQQVSALKKKRERHMAVMARTPSEIRKMSRRTRALKCAVLSQ